MTDFAAKPLPADPPVVKGTPLGFHALPAAVVDLGLKHPAVRGLIESAVNEVQGPTDLVLIAVPAGEGTALCRWFHEHLTIAPVPGTDCTPDEKGEDVA